MYRLSRKCAAFLQSVDIKKGDFVAISASNCIEYTFLILGILGSGATFVPCNPNYKKGLSLTLRQNQFAMIAPHTRVEMDL